MHLLRHLSRVDRVRSTDKRSAREYGSAVAAGRLVLVSEGPSPVFGVADRFVGRWAELEPTQGLIYGLAGTPGRLSDWSPRVGPRSPTPSATGWPSSTAPRHETTPTGAPRR
jgi:hypothetical protein